jgi:hypothetical protein
VTDPSTAGPPASQQMWSGVSIVPTISSPRNLGIIHPPLRFHLRCSPSSNRRALVEGVLRCTRENQNDFETARMNPEICTLHGQTVPPSMWLLSETFGSVNPLILTVAHW